MTHSKTTGDKDCDSVGDRLKSDLFTIAWRHDDYFPFGSKDMWGGVSSGFEFPFVEHELNTQGRSTGPFLTSVSLITWGTFYGTRSNSSIRAPFV